MKHFYFLNPRSLFAVIVSIFFVALSSCTEPKGEDSVLPPPIYDQGKLAEIEAVDTLALRAYVASQTTTIPGAALLSLFLKYNVSVKKFVYRTQNYQGKTIYASGLLVVPQHVPSTKKLYMTAVFHGTEKFKKDAPTNYLNRDVEDILEVKLSQAMGSMGFLVVMPDYVGYGESEGELHPYEDVAIAKNCTDMISAAVEYAKNNHITLTDKKEVVLTGYSQGGFTAVATQKYAEEQGINDFTIVQNVAGSGAYDKLNFAKAVFQINEIFPFVPYYLWVMDVYRKIYNIKEDYQTMIDTPYYSYLKNIGFDFSFALSDKVTLSKTSPPEFSGPLKGMSLMFLNPSALFKSNFRDAVLAETPGVKSFTDALKKNSLTNWIPKAKLTLVFGQADNFVFPLNSRNAYNGMIRAGASATIVDTASFAGKDHFTAVPDYAQVLFQKIIPLAQE